MTLSYALENKIQTFCENYSFSRRETSVLMGIIACGTKHSDLADYLEISPNTLRIHLRNMNQKANTAGISSLLQRFIVETQGAAIVRTDSPKMSFTSPLL